MIGPLGDWDLIIVGAGTAGMACAITAAEHHARVVVIEKASEVGGTLHITGGHMSAAGTRRQRQKGIEDSPDRHFQDVMRISRGTADPVLVRLAVDEAPRTIDWLDDLGFPFAPETPALVYGHELYSVPRTYWGVEAGKSILQTIRPLWDRHVASERITVLLKHELTELVGDNRRVVGVVARGPNGANELRGRAVVLTTGGYASNPSFFAEVTPGHPRLISTARQTSTGDGILAARRLGAQFRDADKYLASLGGLELEPGSGRADWWTAWALVFSPAYRLPREIYVNLHGQRFIAEDEPSPDRRERALLEQPGHKFWCIFDEAALAEETTIVRQWSAAQLRAEAVKGTVIWSADTLEELAHRAGIDANGLIQTVRSYNEAVLCGRDPLGRTHLTHPIEKPPFYALLTYGTSLISFGGLAVDARLRVLDEQAKPIPGLYAAGEILGAAATSGQAFCGGMLLTPSLSFGRLLGRWLTATG
ncbi:MAG: FAD-dependent oxidoreductase [Acidobacteriota bacterium]|nr:FAD-dependent oxidoreductase [Blastocatellia bacterium]MDW8240088.1 FAD-dependent oxidoreductase [Acidobacteriota bacterium]